MGFEVFGQLEITGESHDVTGDSCMHATYPEKNSGLFIVADGVGGERGGDVASKIAVGTIYGILNPKLQRGGFSSFSEFELLVNKAFRQADNNIIAEAKKIGEGEASKALAKLPHDTSLEDKEKAYFQKYNEFKSMATTASVVVVNPNGMVYSANIGDSKIYFVDNKGKGDCSLDDTVGAIKIQIGAISEEESYTDTQDDTQGITHFTANALTAGLGDEKGVVFHTYRHKASRLDSILLTSDGVSRFFLDDDVYELLRTTPAEQVLARIEEGVRNPSEKIVGVYGNVGAPSIDDTTAYLIKFDRKRNVIAMCLSPFYRLYGLFRR